MKDNRSPLWQEIRDFRKNKWYWAIGLLLLAMLGIVIPIIPGIIFVIIVIGLFKKGWMESFRRRFRLWKIKEPDDE